VANCYSAEVVSKRTLSSLLLAAIATLSCGGGSNARPDLPNSVAPGWTLSSLANSPPPPNLPAGGSTTCWKAVYSGPGSPQSTAQIWICGYASETSAFDAEQRARAEAQTVKFQEGRRLIIVQWNQAKKTDLEALIRTIQKRLH
jgi:hypothetical protein